MTQDAFAPLTIAEYAAGAALTDQRSDGGSLAFPLLGLFGETGSLLSELKKKQRDRASYRGYAGAVVEELGDVLWYLTAVASRVGASLPDVFASAASLECKTAELTWAALQPAVMPRASGPTIAFEHTLLNLAGEVGLLVTEIQSQRQKDHIDGQNARFVGVARTLIQSANEAGVTLEAAAVKNLNKIADRWPGERNYPLRFDEDSEPAERLPRKLNVDIFERKVAGRTYVFQQCNGINIGDRLTDNAMSADDYRFHDAFHYAYVAVLGWSPVIRSLFRLKRKSQQMVDEAQDGARATLIEEGITTWIFGQAVELDLFAGMQSGDLPFELLKNVRQFAAGYEAERCPLWLWEEAILQGYAAFRFLREHRRGRLVLDMDNHQMTVETLS